MASMEMSANPGETISMNRRIFEFCVYSINNIRMTKVISRMSVEIKSPFTLNALVILLFFLFLLSRKIMETSRKIELIKNRPKNIIKAPNP